jgi:hypothetical protein
MNTTKSYTIFLNDESSGLWKMRNERKERKIKVKTQTPNLKQNRIQNIHNNNNQRYFKYSEHKQESS